MRMPPTAVDAIKEKTANLARSLERSIDADVVGIFGPIDTSKPWREQV